MTETLLIRLETSDDLEAIREINRRPAFGQEEEGILVDAHPRTGLRSALASDSQPET